MASERDGTWHYLGWSAAFVSVATDVARLFHPALLSDDRAQLDMQVALLRVIAQTASTQRPPPHADQVEAARDRLYATMMAIAQAQPTDPARLALLSQIQDDLDAALATIDALRSRLSSGDI
jgi:membrane carboxypeptidase/penicillin-binding protein PbpC